MRLRDRLRAPARVGLGLALLCAAPACGDGAQDPEEAPEVGLGKLRRLTRAEYNNTVRDLLGDDSRPAAAFLPDDASAGYAANAHAPVSRLHVEEYMRAAERLAQDAAGRLGLWVSCDLEVSGAEAEACARGFITSFGRRAYRRPLTRDEEDALLAVYAEKASDAGFAAGLQLVIQALLQSPHFLYRVELGALGLGDEAAAAGEVVPLTGYELASRLSYLLWASTPDDELLAAAESGALASPAGLEAQAARMLDDPRSQGGVVSFFSQWLELGELLTLQKDAAALPAWSSSLRASMYVETMMFADYVLRDGDGRLETLLTAPWSIVNGPLMEHYGMSPSVGANDFIRVDLPEGQRSGLLTHASLMSALANPDQTNPVLRGKFVRARLLCSSPPPPPPNANISPPAVDPSLPTRERWAQHRADPSCAGCHELMDPIGLGFQHYDAIGRWTEEDGPYPADASGEIIASEDVDGTFYGALELGQRLAGSAAVQRCVARQWLRFALGREETTEDEASLARVDARFAEEDGDLRALLFALVTSDSFRYWRVPAPAQGDTL